MIVPMKKLSLLLYHREKESFLQKLQETGVVHISENKDIESPEALSEELRNSSAEVKKVSAILDRLQTLVKESETEISLLPAGSDYTEKVKDIISRYDEIDAKIDELTGDKENLQKDISQLMPWGNFNPDKIHRLREAGLKPRFFECSVKDFAEIEFGEEAFAVIREERGKVNFVVFQKAEDLELKAEEISLPEIALDKAVRQEKDLEREINTLNDSMCALGANINILEKYLVDQINTSSYSRALVSFGEAGEGKILKLNGWLPAENEKKVNEVLSGYSCYADITDPPEDEQPPILLRNNRFTKLFEPITKIYSLPKYSEVDTTAFFAPFYALYFGLCLGDVGYGFLTLIISLVGYKKLPKSFKSIAILGIILASFTMLSGVMLNTLFGQNIFPLEGNSDYLFNLPQYSQWAFLGSLRNLKNFPAIGFAIMLGVIQILLGVGIRIRNSIAQKGFGYAIEPLGKFLTIVGIFLAIGHKEAPFIAMTGIDISTFTVGPMPFLGILEVGQWLKGPGLTAGYVIAAVGLFMMVLLNTPRLNILKNLGAGAGALYNFVTGIVGDTLSYIRLFALGLAGGLLANAFNTIAFGFISDGLSWKVIFTILLLLFSHSLLFILAFIGSIVHPLRLTFVEFYGNVDFEGGGKEYTPFKREKVTS